MPSTPRPRPLPIPQDSAPATGERIVLAWQEWLRALANDAEAALGAALAYEALNASARDAFLDALEHDAPRLGVPRVALFAPLLSVEQDQQRRVRIRAAMGNDMGSAQRRAPQALLGIADNGERVVAFVAPLYLDFVHVVTCRFSCDRGFAWVRNDPLVHVNDAPTHGVKIDGVAVEPTPLPSVVDHVACAVVAQRGPDGVLPDSLKPLLDLFEASPRENGADQPTGA